MKTRNGLMAVEIHLVTETSISSVFIVAIGVILHVFLKSHLWTRHGTLSWPSRATERQRARARVLLHPSIRTYIISCYDVCDVCVCVVSTSIVTIPHKWDVMNEKKTTWTRMFCVESTHSDDANDFFLIRNMLSACARSRSHIRHKYLPNLFVCSVYFRNCKHRTGILFYHLLNVFSSFFEFLWF